MTTVAHDGAQRIDFPHTIHDELDLSKYKKILFFFLCSLEKCERITN